MLSNSEKMVNHYGQLLLLILGTVFGFTPFGMYNMILVLILPILGIWQLVDFIILWSENGYKKWYIFYISAILIFTFFTVFIRYLFGYNDIIANVYPMIGLACYSIIIACVYLFYWRKK